MSIVTQINDTFEYIEDNLKNSISLEQLSQTANLSIFQLIRLFDRFIGMTPMAYIRARRLAKSLPQLLAGDSILSVALDCGFQYEQSYIRAFKDCYGVTPARFRNRGVSVQIVDVPTLERFTVSANGMIGEAKLLVRPAFTISGELKRYHNLDNLLWGKSLLEGVERCTSRIYTAACRNLSPGVFEHHYLVQNDVCNPVEWQFASGQWASFEYFGLHPLDNAGVTRIRILMSQVIGNWFADNGIYWDGNFTESVNLDKCSDNYCEVTFACHTQKFS
ncbi:helix-turn-helix domain-containing protein [Listeria kieliensis]|uniref:helix-turn-helix domain-containing protein n=1 Tax=Listeria kieliensis TaxID=1621700 RepID=UPI000E20D7AD|nr:AraC family transcriptional regulator [Listeria kieliensis]